MPLPDFQDAFARYLTRFPTKAALGSGTPPDAWAAELAKVDAEAFDPVTATSVNVEGGNVAGSRNFNQVVLVRALHAVRAHLDPDYLNPYTITPPEPMAPQRMGFLVQLGGC